MAPELRTERELSLDFLRVTEAAAIAAARTMGQGDRKYSDQVAVEAMREVMDSVPMRGRVVIGEGERDEAPMLFIGEEVGGGEKSYDTAGMSIEKHRDDLFRHWVLGLGSGDLTVRTSGACPSDRNSITAADYWDKAASCPSHGCRITEHHP